MARQAVIAVRIGHELSGLAQLTKCIEHHLALAEQNGEVLLTVQDQHRRAHLVQPKERRLRNIALRILVRASTHPRLTGLDVARVAIAAARPVAEELRWRRARHGGREDVRARDEIRRRVGSEAVAPQSELSVREAHLTDGIHGRDYAFLE